MFKKDTASPGEPDRVSTIVGVGTEIKGSLKATGGIRIDGRVNGEIHHDGDLVIGEEGVVEASIKARNVTVAGEVRGNVEASGRIELVSTGKLFGDIVVNALIINEGAVFDGHCQMRHGDGSGAPRRGAKDRGQFRDEGASPAQAESRGD